MTFLSFAVRPCLPVALQWPRLLTLPPCPFPPSPEDPLALPRARTFACSPALPLRHLARMPSRSSAHTSSTRAMPRYTSEHFGNAVIARRICTASLHPHHRIHTATAHESAAPRRAARTSRLLKHSRGSTHEHTHARASLRAGVRVRARGRDSARAWLASARAQTSHTRTIDRASAKSAWDDH